MKFFTSVLALFSSFALSEVASAGLRGQDQNDPAATAGSSKTLPNGIMCRFCPDDDAYIFVYPVDDDWIHWHRDLEGDATNEAPETSTNANKQRKRKLSGAQKLSAAAGQAKYEAKFLEMAAGDQQKDEHKAALQAAAESAHREATILAHASKHGNVDDHERLLKDKVLPDGIMCRFCPDDDAYIFVYPVDDDWTHWH